MGLNSKNEFPSLMKDNQDSIWLVQPPTKRNEYYMVCLGRYGKEGISTGRSGDMQVCNVKSMERFQHMPKGFFVEIQQLY